MKPVLSLAAALLISIGISAQNDTLTGHFTDHRDVLAPTLPWGYISGQNSLDDVSKLMKFDAQYGADTSKYIKSILFWIAKTENTAPSSFALATIWSADVNGEPDQAIYNALLNYGNIDTNFSSLTHINGQAYYNAEVELNPALKVPASGVFFAGVEFTAASYLTNQYMYLKMTKNNSFADAETHSWDQWNDYSYNHVNFWQNDSNFAYGVFPVIGDNLPPKPDTVNLSCDSIHSPQVGAYLPGISGNLSFELKNNGPDILNAGDTIRVFILEDGLAISQSDFGAVTTLLPGDSTIVNFGNNLTLASTPGPHEYCVAVKFHKDFDASDDQSCVTVTIQDTSTIGMEEYQNFKRKIFPSPVADDLQIKVLDYRPEQMWLENQLGQLVEEISIEERNGTVRHPVGHLRSGVYFLMEKRDGLLKRTKWLKL
jgi:hypothetical protein